jgi:hypothetical protein
MKSEMAAVRSSETSVSFYLAARIYMPEGRVHHSHAVITSNITKWRIYSMQELFEPQKQPFLSNTRTQQ